MKKILEKLHSVFINGYDAPFAGTNSPAGKPSDIPTSEKKEAPGQNRIRIDLLIHDLKVPLAVIEAGITSLLNRQEKYGHVTEKQAKVLQRALRNTKVTQNLVADALELGRSEKGIMNLSAVRLSSCFGEALVELFDLNDSVVSERIKACHSLDRLKETLVKEGLTLEIDDRLWSEQLPLDEGKIKQILRNLLSNALKFRKREVALKAYKEQGFLLVCIRDDGEGIPAKYHKKIFDCYFQMDPTETCPVRGHGLGLAGVMVLLEDMGGEMILSSDEGRGAEFIVKIPLPGT
jgi:two-component system, OmpR family, sensor kinase